MSARAALTVLICMMSVRQGSQSYSDATCDSNSSADAMNVVSGHGGRSCFWVQVRCTTAAPARGRQHPVRERGPPTAATSGPPPARPELNSNAAGTPSQRKNRRFSPAMNLRPRPAGGASSKQTSKPSNAPSPPAPGRHRRRGTMAAPARSRAGPVIRARAGCRAARRRARRMNPERRKGSKTGAKLVIVQRYPRSCAGLRRPGPFHHCGASAGGLAAAAEDSHFLVLSLYADPPAYRHSRQRTAVPYPAIDGGYPWLANAPGRG